MSVTTDQNDARDIALAWLVSPAASAFAMRRLRSSGFSNAESLAPDVIADAYMKVIQRFESADDVVVENPEAYATTIVHNLIRKLGRGETDPLDDLEPKRIARYETPPSDADDTADELRVLLEQSPAEPWVTSAALACVCFVSHPDTIPQDAPSPHAGATPEQARVWPALWFAGQRDLFPDVMGDPRKRTRARRIATVLGHLDDAFLRFRVDRVRSDG